LGRRRRDTLRAHRTEDQGTARERSPYRLEPDALRQLDELVEKARREREVGWQASGGVLRS